MNEHLLFHVDVGLSNELLKGIVEAVLKQVQAKRIILYGSRARGNYSPVSDIDIAVECDEGIDFAKGPIEDAIWTLLKVDVIDLRKTSVEFRKVILDEGVILYEQTASSGQEGF